MEQTKSGAVAAGSILVEAGTRLPNAMSLHSDASADGWDSVNGSHRVFEQEIEAAGWTFFFMAGEIKATVFGSDKASTLRIALKRLMAKVKSQHCNSIEITEATGHSFLKMPYISVSAHARHLQQGQSFRGEVSGG